MNRVDSNESMKLPLDTKHVTFNKKQLAYLESIYGKELDLLDQLVPGFDRDTILTKAGQQDVLSVIRSLCV